MTLSLPPKPTKKLRLDAYMDDMPDEDEAQLRAWLADENIAASRIAEALQGAGYEISASSVVTYRNIHRG